MIYDRPGLVFRRGLAFVLALIGLVILVPTVVSPESGDLTPEDRLRRAAGFLCVLTAVVLCVVRLPASPNLNLGKRRILMASTAGLGACVSYVASAPFVVALIATLFPRAMPLLQTLYAPLEYYIHRLQWPGSDLYLAYVSWCYDVLTKLLG